jgi:hypothetical protein
MAVLVVVLAIIPAIGQMIALVLFWRRLVRWLQTQPPRTTAVVVRVWGREYTAMARTLAQHTRLDVDEIDELIEQARPGVLPLLLSHRRAHLLAAEMRRLGAEVDLEQAPA